MGIIASYIVTIFGLIGCFYFGRELVEKKSPQVSMTTINVNEPAWIDLNPQKFPINIGIFSFQNYNIPIQLNPRLFDIEVKVQKAILNDNKEMEWMDEEVIQIEICDVDKHF